LDCWKSLDVSAGLRKTLIATAAVAIAVFAWSASRQRSEQDSVTRSAYIEAKQCEACHAGIHDSYQHVAMARSFAVVQKASQIEDYDRENHFCHAPSGRHYEVFRRDGHIFQRRYELDSQGNQANAFEQEATYAIGSGNHARSFLHRSSSGELTELPVTWYTQEGRWGMSPGYDNPTPPDFTRLADESCLFCHNGYPAADGSLAEGIDCQRCHGPGSRHVQLASGGKAPKQEIRSAIVNPARLSLELQMDVCMQCHLETTSAELPGMIRRFEREPYSFRPGEKLGAYMVHFDQPAAAGRQDKFEIVSQAYRLRQSMCFRKSQGRLTCTGCHDPHHAPRGEAAVAQYRSRCLACHASVAGASHANASEADCVSCHMPRRRTEDAVHVVMTDHLISRNRPVQDVNKPLAERNESYRGPLVVYYPEDLADKDRAVYLGVASITSSTYRRDGISLLEHAVQRGIPAKAMAVLGEGYLADGSVQQAIDALSQAVAKDPSLRKARYHLGQALEAAGRMHEARSEYVTAIRTAAQFPEAHFALANLLVKTGVPAEAVQHYQAAIRARPVYTEAHGNLANLYADQGRLDEARNQLEDALRVNPAFAEGHTNLARLLAAQQQLPKALEHARRAVALDSHNAEAAYNFARLLQETGARDAAIAEYRRTLRIKPDLVEAHLSLGQALGDAGLLDVAIVEFREVLRIRPSHAEARRNLDMALEMKGHGGR
jgi:predicted CXXCH cytochrome family protein